MQSHRSPLGSEGRLVQWRMNSSESQNIRMSSLPEDARVPTIKGILIRGFQKP
jgi:hypothetical protein